MKASELINKLKRLKKEYGDYEVYFDGFNRDISIKGVELCSDAIRDTLFYKILLIGDD